MLRNAYISGRSPRSPVSSSPLSPFSSPRKRHRVPSEDESNPSSNAPTEDKENNALKEPGKPRPSSPRRRRTRRGRMDTDGWDLERANARAGNAWRYAVGSITPPPGPMRSFAIERDHPLIPLWAPLRDAIEAALQRSSIRWYALEVYRRRRTLESQGIEDTTVLITAHRKDDGSWRALESVVREICVAHGHHWLQVELIEGTVEPLASMIGDLYGTVPTMGSSLSVAGCDWAAGTLGGYVELRRAEADAIRCALTCHHVLRPMKPTANDPDPTTVNLLSNTGTTTKETGQIAATETATSNANSGSTTEETGNISATETPPNIAAAAGSPDGQALPYDPELDREGLYHPAILTPNPLILVDSPGNGDHLRNIRKLGSTLESLRTSIAEVEGKIEQGFDSSSSRKK